MNILLTSVGRRSYMVQYFKNALKGKGKLFASNSIDTYSLTLADEYTITPKIFDESYIKYLLNYCSEKKIKAIISLFDIDLPVLAKNKECFESEGISVVVSKYEVTKICNDKWKSYNFFKTNNIDTPKTFCYLENVFDSLNCDEIKYPLILKPRWGMGSIGIYEASNDDELRVLYNKVLEKIKETYLHFESEEDMSKSVLIQEKINGKEYGLDVVNDLSEKYVTTVAKRKLAMRAGETDIAEIVEIPELSSLGEKISRNLKHIANLDVDCFIAEDKRVYALEMNCRFGGQYPFSHLAGVNLPKQIVEWLEGKTTNMENLKAKVGTRSCKELVPTIIDNKDV